MGLEGCSREATDMGCKKKLGRASTWEMPHIQRGQRGTAGEMKGEDTVIVPVKSTKEDLPGPHPHEHGGCVDMEARPGSGRR